MPRRRSSPMGGMRGAPSRAPPKMQYRQPPAPAQRLPARAPAASPTPAAPTQSAGPGLFGQMAATAGGVAIGSAVGHMIGNSLSGGRQEVEAAPPQQIQQYQDVPQQQQYQGRVCEFEMKQFMDCAQNQHDLSLCQAFNESLRQCKLANGLQ
ncbi:coiled-coil-helix-coiled-coil-helix domain-containing protein 2-like [Tubulanus polymorphus]|uniref:coiled-coil-helix-coiled-coil-helix domain-containing protein 2-like n=1 Tax=Tubulanus polymorphus TaxID=672921 RepID=UPI003DA426B1